jgi:hypothetical protein
MSNKPNHYGLDRKYNCDEFKWSNKPKCNFYPFNDRVHVTYIYIHSTEQEYRSKFQGSRDVFLVMEQNLSI